MNPVYALVSGTAASTTMAGPSVASASASLLGVTPYALMVENYCVRVTSRYSATEIHGVQGYIDATTDGVRQVLVSAASGMGAEDEEALPARFRQAGDPTHAAVRELAKAALDKAERPSKRRAAAIGLGMLSAGDPAAALEVLRTLLADPNVGIAEGALRAVDWGSVDGLKDALDALATDVRRPAWLRSYAADLAG